MTCDQCRLELAVLEGERDLAPAAREHLAVCDACQDYFEKGGGFRAQVRALAGAEHAPEVLHAQVQEMVHDGKARPKTPQKAWIGIAAGIVLIALCGFGLLWYRSGRALSPDRLTQTFIADHLHYLPGREQILSSSAQDIERWFQGRLDFPVRVPAVPAAVVEDARVCDVAGRKAALVHYRRKSDDTLISFFIADAPQGLREVSDSGLFGASYQGCNGALWCRRGLLYSLVATLDDRDLKQLAESVRQQQP